MVSCPAARLTGICSGGACASLSRNIVKMAGAPGFEPGKWRIQSPLPYHLATPQWFRFAHSIGSVWREIENGPERVGPFLNALAALVRHRGADRVPHATDLLAHQGQRADHRDADEDHDETVLGICLARLATEREPIHHDHPLHPRAARFN